MSTTFESLGLSPALSDALRRDGVTEPFPIQEQAIPHGLAGRDIQGRAPTGSGKTLAFGLPLLSRVPRAQSKRPTALILAPTRELAEQIRRDLAPIAHAADRRITAIFGGVGYGPQKKALKAGVDVLVATPGRLEDLVGQRFVYLERVQIVVIDEADRMADMGFLPAVRRILDGTNPERQTLLFSATLDGEVATLAGESQTNPVTVVAEATGDRELDLDHHFWRVERSERVAHAARVIAGSQRTIVFTRTRRGADRLVKQLGREEIRAVAMHGGRSQNQRTRALRAFSDGKARALVATDVAARGIHVEDIDVVLHYDLANDHKDYVHRSGRTARAGAAGTVISLVVDGQDRDAKRIQRAIDVSVPIRAPEMPTAPQDLSRSERVSIFVGNLPWRVDDADLEALFAEHGLVSRASIVTHKKTGRSKGFGFVEMPAGHGQGAITALNGSELDGRKLRVRVAH